MRKALERAQKRRSEAVRALEFAQEVVSAANAEVDKIVAELADLESALARAPTQEQAAPASICGAYASKPISGLHHQLQAVLAHLKSDSRIDPSLIAMAEAHSAQLLEGFRATFDAAESRAKPASIQSR